ncbi:Pyridoxal-dependent decarboxylase domain-containing protein 1 [Geodia barretti]|uniref:Pyridoxal-dependent decarboxylase domain-containing protein 1 n=1 Tax=Geodia barretti TaxID=519541 RepID=A0AA35TBJ9_GEOBA|nr:Pyridoxal-dependent decarboxylase domain-containing protein 1 [Geodia barretti]
MAEERWTISRWPGTLGPKDSVAGPTSTEEPGDHSRAEEEVEDGGGGGDGCSEGLEMGTVEVGDDQPPPPPPPVAAAAEAAEESQPPTQLVVDPLPLPTANVTNMMIAKELYHFFPKVGITTLKLPGDGLCFKFDPIHSFPEHSTSIEDVDSFIDALKQKALSLHTTSLLRCLVESTLRGQPNLRCLEFPSFFAGGFIQYVPTDWATKVELTLEEVNKLNKLNLELASDLATRDPVYTPFQHGNFTCIMIKELPPGTNISGFLTGLLTKTREFEEHKKFLDGMSQKIVKGIEEAQKDIHNEKQKKDGEQGFLHSIPVVGSLWGWFAPPTPTTPEGRTFNLSQGKVKTTGEIYKHKMQVNETSQPDMSASLAALPSLKDTESVASDVSSAAVPAMPSLEQGDGDSSSEHQHQTEGEVEVAGGEGGDGGGEEERVGTETEATKSGGGGESTSQPQNPEQ